MILLSFIFCVRVRSLGFGNCLGNNVSIRESLSRFAVQLGKDDRLGSNESGEGPDVWQEF